jgi:hypothetical protein
MTMSAPDDDDSGARIRKVIAKRAVEREALLESSKNCPIERGLFDCK